MIYKILYTPISKLSHKEKVALETLYSQISFEVPNTDINKPFIFYRYAFKEILRLFYLPIDRVVNNSKKALLVNDGVNGIEGAEQILKINNIENDVIKISYESLSHISYYHKLKVMFLILLLIFTPKTYKKRFINLKNYLLLPRIISNYYITISQSINKFERVYLFGAYRPETNLISYKLQQIGIETNIYVSGTPLVYFFQNIICNNMLLSNPYQVDEINYKVLKNPIFDNYFLTKPLKAESFRDFYSFNKTSTNVHLCVYTSGIWKRIENGVSHSEEMGENEDMLFGYLNIFLLDNKHITVRICLHPIEKNNAVDYRRSKEYYMMKLNNQSNISFCNREDITSDSFSTCIVSLSILSNTVYERLFCGHKALIILKRSNEKFPIKQSTINSIIASNYIEFKSKLKSFLVIDNKMYFINNDIKKYRYLEYGKK